MTVTLLPAFEDNYLFSLEKGSRAAVVDPGRAEEVLRRLEEAKLKLELILVTHHHGDHIGGVKELVKKTGAKVYGPADLADYGVSVDRAMRDGDHCDVLGTDFLTIEVPGHTLDHLAYWNAKDGWLFCGDTLFSLGCGRLFEGSFEQMFASLRRLKELPDDTKVFCAHEYTLTNAKFSLEYARGTKSDHAPAYADLLRHIESRRARGERTVPSTLKFERDYNLFLKAETLEEFKKVRLARNVF